MRGAQAKISAALIQYVAGAAQRVGADHVAPDSSRQHAAPVPLYLTIASISCYKIADRSSFLVHDRMERSTASPERDHAAPEPCRTN